MNKSLFALFDTVDDTNEAVRKLESMGYSDADISLVTKEDKVNIDHDSSEGITEGAKVGGVAGGVLGLLVGLGAIAIPGIGALFVAGPIAAALGLTGVVGTTATGAVTGALAGGFVAALKELGVDEPAARKYEEEVKNGAILLVVAASEGEENDVADALEDAGAKNVKDFELRPAH